MAAGQVSENALYSEETLIRSVSDLTAFHAEWFLNRPFYSCLLSDPAYEWQQGCR